MADFDELSSNFVGDVEQWEGYDNNEDHYWSIWFIDKFQKDINLWIKEANTYELISKGLHKNATGKEFLMVLNGLEKLNISIDELSRFRIKLCYTLYDTNNLIKLRRKSAILLGKIQSNKSLGTLIASLGDYDEELRIAVAHSLGKINDKRAIGPLIEATKDSSEKVQIAANMALRKIKFDMLANINMILPKVREQVKELEVKINNQELSDNEYLEIEGTILQLKQVKEYALNRGNEILLQEVIELINALEKFRPTVQSSTQDSVENRSGLVSDESSNLMADLR